MFAPSYSSFFPARNETTPSSMTSVSRAAYSKGHAACVLPFAASTQFISCPSFGIRGSFCGGFPTDSCSDLGSSRGFTPYVSCSSLPLLPTSSAPPPLLNSSSPISAGFGGRNPPSYHVSLTAGLSPRAGDSDRKSTPLNSSHLLISYAV